MDNPVGFDLTVAFLDKNAGIRGFKFGIADQLGIDNIDKALAEVRKVMIEMMEYK